MQSTDYDEPRPEAGTEHSRRHDPSPSIPTPYSPSNPPSAKRKFKYAQLVSYVIFLTFTIRNFVLLASLSNDAALDSSFYDMIFDESETNNNINNIPITKVLITRTVSSVEIPIVIDDIMHVKSFYTGEHEELMRKSRMHCNTLMEAGYDAELDPHVNGSQTFPNHILCDSDIATMDNNYHSVHADFMLFARSEEYAANITAIIDNRTSNEIKRKSLYEMDIDIQDVSSNPRKVWNWVLRANDDKLAGYDYVWFMDGDMSLKAVNWQAFWQQVKLLRPKITQPSVIGNGPEGWSTAHPILRYHKDSRVLAGAVPILEVQAPLLQVDTWLSFRQYLTDDPEPTGVMRDGAEQCFDMAWCHWAINNFTGTQATGPIDRVGYRDFNKAVSLTNDDVHDSQTGRGCVVLYQVPIVHISRHSLTQAMGPNALMCRYFRLKRGVIGKGGLKKIYELFNYPKPSYIN